MLDLLKFKITGKNQSGSAFAGVRRDLVGVKGMMAGVNQQARRMGRTMRNVGAGMTLGVTAPMIAMGKQMITLYDQQQQAENAVSTAISSTGGAAGRSLDQLKGLASGLQEITTFGDEDILRNVTAPLLTFTQVQGDVFDRAQANVLDYATLLQTDLRSASIQVGKALNDPIKGVTALGKAGVQFSDSQKGMIKTMVEAGNVAGAQSLILNELETQFKGQAAAVAAAPLGQWKQLSNAIGDVKEEMGKEIVPFLKPLAEQVKLAVKWFGQLSPQTKRTTVIVAGLTAVVGPLVAGLGLVVLGVSSVGSAFVAMGAAVLANPIIAAVAGIAAGAYLIYRNWDGISAWFSNLWNAVSARFWAAWEGIKGLLLQYTPVGLIYDHWSGISDWFSMMWTAVKQAFSGNIEGVRTLLLNFTPAGLIYQNWDGISAWFLGKLGSVSTMFRHVWGIIKGFLASDYSPQVLIKDAWAGIGGWFAGLWSNVVAGFKTIWAAVVAEVSQWDDRMIQVGKDMILGLVQGLKSNPSLPGAALDVAGKAIIGGFKKQFGIQSPSRLFAGFGQNIVEGLAIGIRDTASLAVGEVQGMGDQISEVARQSTSLIGAFRDGAKSIFASVLTRANTFRGALSGVLSGFGNRLITGGIDQLFDTIWPFAQGGALQNGRVLAYAGGGVVDRPTTFPMAGGSTGLMGEAGPEAILPLSRGADGRLGVKSPGGGGGGGGDTVNIHYNPVIDARGADQGMVERIDAQVQALKDNMEGTVHSILRAGRNRGLNRAWQGS